MKNYFLNSIVACASLISLILGCGMSSPAYAQVSAQSSWQLKGPMHQRLKWKAEDYFTDAGILKLCKAIEAKDLKEIERLVKSGVDVNAKGRGNMTPLLWAFPMGEEAFKKLLELGADPNVRLTEQLGLRLKGKSVTFACVELTSGLIYNQDFYDVPMDNYLELVLKHGGNPNQEDIDGDTPLASVRWSNRKIPEKIKLLLDAGGDINHRNAQGKTPLLCANLQNSECILCLLNAGADYRIASSNKGWDPILMLALLTTQNDDTPPIAKKIRDIQYNSVIEWFKNEGANLDAARAALKDKELMKRLKDLPADYKHRPWYPQRPTLKKPAAEKK